MNETDIKHTIMIELSKRGNIVFNRPTGNFYTKNGNTYTPIKINIKGASDLQGHTLAGKCFYIECKTPKEFTALVSRIERNSLTEHDKDQINFLQRMHDTGALAGFADSVESALRILEVQQ